MRKPAQPKRLVLGREEVRRVTPTAIQGGRPAAGGNCTLDVSGSGPPPGP